MPLPHTSVPDDAQGSLLARAIAFAEATFAEARRDERLSGEGRIEALDALQHSRRVAYLMYGIAAAFGRDCEQFGAAGILHDVGKAAIAANGRRAIMETISQSGGLSDREKSLVGRHGSLGADLIDEHFDETIAVATALHCEYGAEQLTFLEVALQAADIYDALRSPRAYKSGESHARALIAVLDQAPAVGESLILFLATRGDRLWSEAWDEAPGMYGSQPIQLSAGIAA